MSSRITYRKLSTGNVVGRFGSYYIFIRKREHGKWDGFDRYRKWYSAYISLKTFYVEVEGTLGSSLGTIRKAKAWVRKKLIG